MSAHEDPIWLEAGQEWNNELNEKLKRHKFKHLQSNPCTYIQTTEGDEFDIITVWVDDLMLFALSSDLNERMKSDLKS